MVTCHTCVFFRSAEPRSGNAGGRGPCEQSLATWWPLRGYGACPAYEPVRAPPRPRRLKEPPGKERP